MHPDYFSIIKSGLFGELRAIDLPEVLACFRNHQGNFLFEPATISVYLMRLFEESAKGPLSPEALETLRYLLAKYEQLEPFELQTLRLLAQLFPSPALQKRIQVVEGVCRNLDAWKRLSEALQRFEFERAVPRLEAMLADNRHDVMIAGALLLADHLRGLEPGPWLSVFEPAKPLRAAWDRKLFLHYAGINSVEKGLALFEGLAPDERKEFVVNGAAELYMKAGEREKALELYQTSLDLDPAQTPVRFRRAELASPLAPRPDLLGTRTAAVYLYTYNKADLLRRTLESLRGTRIGQSAIAILVNGCSDDSLAVAESAAELFPENPVEIINLPVNVGAPAARNWLINREETWKRDYAAFLDDDVLLQADWMEYFLAAMEDRPKAAAVGCKILDPGTPAKYQYLYRSVAVARDNLFKLSIARPSHQFDAGLYDFLRPTRNVMGCQHMFRTTALQKAPFFDIRFSPSQVDDIDHDLLLCLKGFDILYCGQVGCVHAQSSGLAPGAKNNAASFGNAVGNDVKLFFKHRDHMDALKKLVASGQEPL